MEVLTLQLGAFSNHVGSHFWNFQDELAALEASALSSGCNPSASNASASMDLDFARLYCEVETGGVVNWRPRLVLTDKRGALLAVRPGNGGPPEPEPEMTLASAWDHETETHCAERVPQHPFLKDLDREELGDEDDMAVEVDGARSMSRSLGGPKTCVDYNFTETVRSWADYLKVPLHDSNIHQLHSCREGVDPFAAFFDGQLLQGTADEEALLDLIRKQFETCDQLDAVQTIADMHDGFGGLADIVLRWVCEEQPKCGRLVFHVRPPTTASESGPRSSELDKYQDESAWLNAAFSFASILELGVNAWVPLAVPLWTARPAALPDMNTAVPYEAAALLATGLETASLPYRLIGSTRPSHFLSALTPPHQPTCGLSLALPAPALPQQQQQQLGVAAFDPGSFFFDLAATPIIPGGNPYSSCVFRGAPPQMLLGPLSGAPLPERAKQLSLVHPLPLPLPVTFPQVFSPRVSTRGLLLPTGASLQMQPLRPASAEVEACPTATLLHAASLGDGAKRCAALNCMVHAVRPGMLRVPWVASLLARYGVEADGLQEVRVAVAEQLGAEDSDDG